MDSNGGHKLAKGAEYLSERTRSQYRNANQYAFGRQNSEQNEINSLKSGTIIEESVEEDDDVTDMRLAYERIVKEQLVKDERIARQIQDKLLEQDYSQRMIEEEDERLAKKLAEKEKERLARKRLQREKLQVEKLSAQLNSNKCDNSNGQAIGELATSVDAIHLLRDDTTSLISDDDIDLSEFCMQPPPGLSGEELRLFLEEQDAEIARFLQQQECKRKSSVNKDRFAVIEAQDYEIAKLLQKEEKERIKRLKEKARKKELEKQRQSEASNLPQVNNEDINNHVYAEHMTLNRTEAATAHYSDVDSITYEEPFQIYHHNIAIDLDPTYKRNSTASDLNHNPLPKSTHYSPPSSISESRVYDSALDNVERGIHFAQVYKVSSSSTESSPVSTTARELNAMDNETVPPYLPVQGQRRISSVKKKKKSRDNCKTQ